MQIFLFYNSFVSKEFAKSYENDLETYAPLLQHQINDYIRFSIDLSPEYVTPIESMATYNSLQQYVLQQYGVKVSVSNITQTKRKYGLIMRKNYNKSKNPNVCVCPLDKEKMIVEALQHFQMI